MPIAVDIEDSGLKEIQAHLQAAPARIEQRVAGRTNRAIRDLLRVARSVVHVRTGRLQASLAIEGPNLIGAGTLEAAVTSNVSYAEQEADKGGEHDYAARTLAEGADVIEGLARDLEVIVIEETGAGRG